MKNVVLLLLFAGLACGCAWLQHVFGPVGELVSDEGVQNAAGGVIYNVISGNWLGAAASLGELIAVAGGTWQTINITRDRRRRKRGEPVTMESAGPVPAA